MEKRKLKIALSLAVLIPCVLYIAGIIAQFMININAWKAAGSDYITDWIELIAGWLSERGYHLDGKMFAVVEGGMSYYTITVDGAKVTSTEFTPEATYVSEFNDLLYED